MFAFYTASTDGGGKGLTEAEAVKAIATELDISTVFVSASLPYHP